MKKGLSLMTLLITISVILVLTSTVVISGNSIYNNSKKTKFATEISYIQELVDSYKLNNEGYPSDKTVFLDVSNINNSDIEEQFKDESISENTIVLNNIDYNKINSHELAFGNSTDSSSDDRYFVSTNTGKVYYMKGLKIGNKTYYSLTDDLKKHINYVEKNNVNDGIIFTTKSSFNNKVNIDINIPSSYIDIQVTSSDKEFTFEVEKSNNYNIYKTTSLANSVITIKYRRTENDQLKEIKYNVINVDNEPPTFSLSDIKILKNSDTNEEERYVSIENINDNLSGIKCIKYVNFEVKEASIEYYFKNRNIGINLKTSDRNIIIKDNVNFITVYVEDNAGNYSYEVKKVGDKEVDYIHDGLILCLDGIKNTRDGHSNTTNVWEDLSGKEKDCNLINFSYNEESGWKGNGLIFDGYDDGVYLGNKIKDLFKEDFSIEFLLSCDEQNTRDVLMGNYAVSQNINFENYYNSFRLYWNGGEINYIGTNVLFEKDILKYICITLDKEKGILKIYENGKLFDTITNSKLSSYNYDYINAYIGRDNRTGTTSFKGIINSVRIYTKQLIQEEIEHNYKIDKIRFEI